MSSAPKVIYLQWYGVDREDLTAQDLEEQAAKGELTWCSDKKFDTDVKYVRADTVPKRKR